MIDFTPFANRLRKSVKHWKKWARRRGIDCFRIYDRDIPEFPFAVDWYDGQVHVQEFVRAETSFDEQEAELLQALCNALEVESSDIALKTRKRQKGLAQYEKTGTREEDFVVEEGGLEFYVNLHAYLDTGLFLDHRVTRGMVRERAAGRRFLNLFAYTGSFSVYAADGGASGSITVDLSNTYQAWTARNFELNGMDQKRHRLVRADVFRFLETAKLRQERFDLIVMDPPSFSNSKKMEGVLDVQRDHVRLIQGCLDILNPGGELFFSNNLRRFRLDPSLRELAMVEEITQQTVPEDFKRHRPHQCWVLRK